MFQNLTKLQVLKLSFVNISSTIPKMVANMSSLVALDLQECELYGEVPIGIFLLPNLQILDMSENSELTGHLPEFHKNNSLTSLILGDIAFSGSLSDSIGNLKLLKTLSLSYCNFSGSFPTSLSNLTQLISLDLTSNNFIGEVSFLEGLSQDSQLNVFLISGNKLSVKIPSQLGMLSKLTFLDLSYCNMYGNIPSSMANLSKLSVLHLSNNHITGTIPLWLTNLTEMFRIDFSGNQLQGSLPSSFSQLKNLMLLDVSYNNLTVSLNSFLGLKNLTVLDLSSTKIIDVINNDTNSTSSKIRDLYLLACNLRMFPNFLRFINKLQTLDLSFNQIEGMVPEWLYNMSTKTLQHFDLSHNSIIGFEKRPSVLPWSNLLALDLSYNMLEGSLPIPPKSMIDYRAINNNLSGEIPQRICSVSHLQFLDLSNNKLEGIIPLCWSNSLEALNLSSNNFYGIHQFFANDGHDLRLVDFSQNQIQGKFPTSFINFKKLEFLSLGNNEINDTFPHWLETLEELQVLVLRSNKFHGVIETPKNGSSFGKLRIIDLSDNGFTGNLPLEYISNWKAMQIAENKMTYMQTGEQFKSSGTYWYFHYQYSMTVTNKGLRLLYQKIPNLFVVVDLSRNKFERKIPESFGDLVGLQVLNLANNNLVGPIPPSLGKLSNLESLDLSINMLSGEIPQELVSLKFLGFLNLSYNNLTGTIPQGKQFNTFESNSFLGNAKLCGVPLSNKCENSNATEFPLQPHLEDSKYDKIIGWIIIILGYGSGLVVGVVLGNIFTSKYHQWFEMTFARPLQRKRRRGTRVRRN